MLGLQGPLIWLPRFLQKLIRLFWVQPDSCMKDRPPFFDKRENRHNIYWPNCRILPTGKQLPNILPMYDGAEFSNCRWVIEVALATCQATQLMGHSCRGGSAYQKKNQYIFTVHINYRLIDNPNPGIGVVVVRLGIVNKACKGARIGGFSCLTKSSANRKIFTGHSLEWPWNKKWDVDVLRSLIFFSVCWKVLSNSKAHRLLHHLYFLLIWGAKQENSFSYSKKPF